MHKVFIKKYLFIILQKKNRAAASTLSDAMEINLSVKYLKVRKYFLSRVLQY